jgi:hypothetical protein
MSNIEKAIRDWYKQCFETEEELDKFLNNSVFTIEFGEFDVWENRNQNPVLVTRKGMRLSIKNKNGQPDNILIKDANGG